MLFAAGVAIGLLVIGIYGFDEVIKLRVQNELLTTENESLDEGRRSWRAEAKKRRKQMAQMREDIGGLDAIAELQEAEIDLLYEDVQTLVDELEATKAKKSSKKSTKKTKSTKKGK